MALIAGFLVFVYYHHLECWQKPSLCLLLILYWSGALACESFVIANLYYTDHMSITVIRWDLTVVKMFLYTLLLTLELNVFRCWVRKPTVMK